MKLCRLGIVVSVLQGMAVVPEGLPRNWHARSLKSHFRVVEEGKKNQIFVHLAYIPSLFVHLARYVHRHAGQQTNETTERQRY